MNFSKYERKKERGNGKAETQRTSIIYVAYATSMFLRVGIHEKKKKRGW